MVDVVIGGPKGVLGQGPAPRPMTQLVGPEALHGLPQLQVIVLEQLQVCLPGRRGGVLGESGEVGGLAGKVAPG